MKIIPNILRKILPVSHKAHTAALAKAHQQAESDQNWLLSQLRQVTAANVRLESKLYQSSNIPE